MLGGLHQFKEELLTRVPASSQEDTHGARTDLVHGQQHGSLHQSRDAHAVRGGVEVWHIVVDEQIVRADRSDVTFQDLGGHAST